MRAMRVLAAILAGLLPGAPAGPAESPSVDPAGLLVAGAVSLREPLGEIARRYETARPGTRVELALGASSVLAAQIRAGAPIDVFVSADSRIVDALVRDGVVESPANVPFARNRLVVLRAADTDLELRSHADLLQPGVRRVAVPDGAVPVGRYARDWLASCGILSALSERLVPTEHARATLAAVDLGHADVAIVYATDARVARSARLAFEVPAGEQPRIVYAAARLGTDAASRHFFAFLLGDEAADVLRAAGFAAP